jgi:ribonuclease VapC
MVIDTSAIVSVLLEEPEAEQFLDAIAGAESCLISAVSYMETAMVIIRHFGESTERELDLMLLDAEVEVVPVSVRHAQLAIAAFRNYGKGRHPAGLNFGDCFSYALAKSTGEPLLFKGLDFTKTDVVSA